MSAVLATLQLLVPTGPIEIRILGERMHVDRFDSHAAAAAHVAKFEPKAKGAYVVMNPFDSAKVTIGVTDAAVTSRRWLLVDVDPVRPKDFNATKDELAISASTASAIEAHLTELGWPLPVRALSGNGAHLLYRIDLPNDQPSKALVDGVLRYLDREFTSAKAVVDTTVSNAARITKLYGTVTRKGPHTEERPHRLSKITRTPDPLVAVSRDLLELVAAKAPALPQPAPKPVEGYEPGGAYDLGDVLARVVVLGTKERDGATWYLIKCPWFHEHTSTDGPADAGVVVQPDGAMAFKCLHSHCAYRKWQEFRDLLGIDTKAWKQRAQHPARVPELRLHQESTPTTAAPAESRTEPHPREKSAKRVTIGDAAKRAQLLERMDIYARTGAMPGAISTGMPRLDGMLLGGFRPGKFYVLGGETGRGKTSLLLQWAYAAAPRVDLVGMITPEMDEDSVDERALSALTGFGVSDYRHGHVRARREWEECWVPQNVRASFDASDMAAFVEEERPSLFIVDYAQQAVSYDTERRHTALAMLGAECLDIAKRYRIPVILGTQVNVTADREFSVRETRILEHQADAMIFIDIVYDKQTDADGRRQVKSQSLLIGKNRHGYAGRIPINWQASLFRFEEA